MSEMQLDTLTERYWQDFELASGDLEHLSEVLIEEEAPMTAEALTRRLVQKRLADEKAIWDDRESKGQIYQPRDSYSEGDHLVFSTLGDVVGTVVAVRPGRHPDYAPFDVIQVQMEGSGETKEFAANLGVPHALNFFQVGQEADIDLGDLTGVSATLSESYGQYVKPVLLRGLRESPEFADFGEEWFLKGFMLPIEEGHLNLAEAVLDLAAGFSTAQQILEVLEMPPETSQAVQVFSLNHALSSDTQSRFRYAGTKTRMEWCLPRVADSRPLRFERGPMDISRDHDLDLLVEIITDESASPNGRGETHEWSHVLTFYDWYWGHLPYDQVAMKLLPQPFLEDQACGRVHLRPAGGEDRFSVVIHYPSEGHLGWWGSAELRGFFEAKELAPGATIVVRRTPASETDGVYEVDYLPGPATRVEMLDYDESRQPVFRRLSLKCAVDEEMALPRSRFSALEALRFLDESERRVTPLLLKTAFQRVGEKMLRGLGIVYRASFADLFVATNIERPLPWTVLQAIFEQDVYPCFRIDDDGLYVYDPGKSDTDAKKVRLTWDQAILDAGRLAH
jgi:hypothetical protein